MMLYPLFAALVVTAWAGWRIDSLTSRAVGVGNRHRAALCRQIVAVSGWWLLAVAVALWGLGAHPVAPAATLAAAVAVGFAIVSRSRDDRPMMALIAHHGATRRSAE